MQTPMCGRCGFTAIPAEGEPASYAFALCHGAASVASVLEAAHETAFSEALPGVAAYCLQCRRVTWLSRHADLQIGLVHMLQERERWRALHAVLSAQ